MIKRIIFLACLMLAPAAMADEINGTLTNVYAVEHDGKTIVGLSFSFKGSTSDVLESPVTFKAELLDASGAVIGHASSPGTIWTFDCHSCVAAKCDEKCEVIVVMSSTRYENAQANCSSSEGPCQGGVRTPCWCNSATVAAPLLEILEIGGSSIKGILDIPGDIDPTDNSLTVNVN